MRTALMMVMAAALLAGCNDEEPTAADIEEGYRNLVKVNMERALADYGTRDNMPPILVGMIETTAKVELTGCEKEDDDTGFVCLYNMTPINGANVMLDEIPDVKARVYQGDLGWMVNEIKE
ncbi:hypothetical protein [Aliiroseovarius crassostreae]|nr:hypothetical protein [Aliiroseovarius crassostreae]